MQIPLRVTFDGADRSEAMEARIRTEVESLDRYHPRITACRVTVHAPPKHHRKGGTWTLSVVLTVPTGEVHAGREPGLDHAHEDPFVAIRDAFVAARRRLQDHARRMRDEVKTGLGAPAKMP